MIRVLQVGLGPIGRAIAARLLRSEGVALVGAVDPRDELVGRDLGEVAGGARMSVAVRAGLDELPPDARPDVALQATGSRLPDVADQLRELAERGISVVSTCEELAYPFYRHPDLSRALDAAARANRAVILGTGVNPGFVMDKLVATLLAACDVVQRVRVRRIVDARTRREPFQHKIGAGLSPAEFERLRAAGRVGHVGLAESAHMLADAMGLGAEREVRETLRPVLARGAVASRVLRVEPGQVAGIDQTATLACAGEERVLLELQMVLGAERSIDEVAIDGAPPLAFAATTGVPGDSATAAVAVSCAARIGGLPHGLRTMLDVPLRPLLQSRPA